MKKLIKILSAILLFFFLPFITKACEIIITVDGAKKEVYKSGDVVVLKITVLLKHRNCDVDINETAINVSGAQITGTTKWVTTSERTWERKIKIKILNGKSTKAVITAERTCDKDGGKGSLILVSST